MTSGCYFTLMSSLESCSWPDPEGLDISLGQVWIERNSPGANIVFDRGDIELE